MVTRLVGGRSRLYSLLAAMGAAALLALAGCGSNDEQSGGGSKTTKVKVGVLPISNVAPLYLGMKKGFFKQEGLEIEPAPAQSGNEIVTAMVSGDLQFAFLGYVPASSARAQGLPIKLIANADNGAEKAKDEWTLIMVQKDSPIRSVGDLAGKTIAVNALKGVGEVVIKAALDKQGVDPNSIKLLEVPFPEMPAALKAKRVDAIWAPEPFLTSVMGGGGRGIEAPLTTLGAKFPNGTYATTEQYLGKNKDAVERFARAMNKSSDYASKHPDEARATIPQFTKIPAAVAKKIRLPLWPTKIDRQQLQQLINYAVKYKVIEKAPPLDELIWEGAS
ncbi:MAG: ABC transporter substrate-binding protein [Actinomycetota bacterium]|nr:ABC transporter substrate-binding protein [Actinomycetota bacterium]